MRFSLVAVGAAALMAGSVQGASVTWNGSNGDWNHGSRWSGGTVPVLGDHVTLSSGAINYWGVQSGQLGADIRNNSTVVVDGATVTFQNRFGFSVGYNGTGESSSLTINSGAYNANASQLLIGNITSGEAGTVTVAPGATLDGSNTELVIQTTGVFNSAGTVSDFTITVVRGFLNVTGGSLEMTRLDLVNTGSRFTISGGVVTGGFINPEYIGYGGRYVNFAPDSTGILQMTNLDVATLSGYVNSGYIRLDGVASPESFVVTAFGENGSQVSVVPEPASAALLGLGLAALGRRRRSVVA